MNEIAIDIEELNQLVGDVLISTRFDFSNGDDRAKFPHHINEIEFVSLLVETVSRFELEHQCCVQTDLPASTLKANIDSALFRRVVVNLLGNSLKYSTEKKDLLLKLTTTANIATLEVSDRGMGVSKENLERLFEPFFRTEKSRNKNAGGMGLGLTLAKRIVEAHGGAISASQRQGGGLTVTVALPLMLGTDQG